MCHTTLQKGLINKIYHGVRVIQFKRKHKEIISMQKTKGKDLLDVGCGTGDFIKHMRKRRLEGRWY